MSVGQLVGLSIGRNILILIFKHLKYRFCEWEYARITYSALEILFFGGGLFVFVISRGVLDYSDALRGAGRIS